MKRNAIILLVGSILLGLAVVQFVQFPIVCYAVRDEGVRGLERGEAVRGPEGRSVAVLPDGARRIVIGDQHYYVSEGVYYQPCPTGFCIIDTPVPDPDDDTDDDTDDNTDNDD